ncbi:MAG: sulfite exporter TauE/SafE family protein [Bacteroidia bacterium]|nr:sulfite exporter TauE/SafE family protein [Bacteroidia bacterium]
MPEVPSYFYFLLFLAAFLYSAVGHGGASAYIALMSLFGFAPDFIRPAALIMNLGVSALAFFHFRREGHFNKNIFIPLALASIPASFAGGLLVPDDHTYKFILGILLIFPVIQLSGLFPLKRTGQERKSNVWILLISGLVIGFLSGLIGIGGGILLSPLLLLFGWANVKQTAAVSSLFIFVNSLSGMAGQLITGFDMEFSIIVMLGSVLVGGFAGAYLGSVKWRKPVLEKLLAMVLLIASVKLLGTG